MRIAYVAPAYAPEIGGMETHIQEVARRIAAAGHTVEVLVHTERSDLPLQECRDGVLVRRFPIPPALRGLALAPALGAYLTRQATMYDLVHAHNYHSPPALSATLAYRGPLVFTPHYHPRGRSRYRRWLHVPYRVPGALIFWRAGRIICVSRQEADLVARRFPPARGRITVIPNGVDVAAFQNAEPLSDEGHVRLLCVGRVERYKRVDRVVDAMRHLDGFHLDVVGTGSALPALREHVATAGVGNRVSLHGTVATGDLARLYRSAAISLTLSEHESFSITPREALAAGSGVVLSDIPAHRELAVEAGADRVALVSASASPQDIATTIRSLATTPRTSAYLPASWDDVAARTLDVYRDVLRGRGA